MTTLPIEYVGAVVDQDVHAEGGEATVGVGAELDLHVERVPLGGQLASTSTRLGM